MWLAEARGKKKELYQLSCQKCKGGKKEKKRKEKELWLAKAGEKKGND